MKLLIINPMQEEMDWFLHGCSKRGLRLEDSVAGRLATVYLPELGVTVAQGGVGKAQFAAQTQHLLDIGRAWDMVVCAGAAGGLVDELDVGDVVVATETVEHDYGNRFTDRPVPRFKGAQAAIDGLGAVRHSPDAFRVHFGAIASGDEDIVDGERRQELHLSTRALAVAWEGAGGARACQFSSVPFVEVRGITDAANHNAPSDFEVNLETAMNNVAALIVCWVGG